LTNEPITQASSKADVYKILSGTAASGEYFLIENRQQTGFDAGLPSSGLLIWHIDAAQSTNANECYPGGPSCSEQHYKVALVQADSLWDLEQYTNKGDAGDPFPGSTNKTSFSVSSIPNSNLYSGSKSNVSITNISASGPTMTATLGIGDRSVGAAVNNTALTWTMGGNANWFGQSSVSYDGTDAAQSGAIEDSQSSWVQTTVTGPGLLSFYWKVSSELLYDYLTFYIDDVEQFAITGEIDWEQRSVKVPSGAHTLKWVYSKDDDYSLGSDSGWLDKVEFGATIHLPWLLLLLN
jgi:hypothetical protein